MSHPQAEQKEDSSGPKGLKSDHPRSGFSTASHTSWRTLEKTHQVWASRNHLVMEAMAILRASGAQPIARGALHITSDGLHITSGVLHTTSEVLPMANIVLLRNTRILMI